MHYAVLFPNVQIFSSIFVTVFKFDTIVIRENSLYDANNLNVQVCFMVQYKVYLPLSSRQLIIIYILLLSRTFYNSWLSC